MRMVCKTWYMAGVATMIASLALAQDIRIVKQGTGKSEIDLSGLQAVSGQGGALKQVLREDLKRSGFFSVVDGVAAVTVRGKCAVEGGMARIDAEVANIPGGTRYFTRTYEEPATVWRRAAHRLADDIVKAVKGKTGIASTRIAMVGAPGGRKNLYVCDADGEGLVQLTRDDKPCMTPAWTPDVRQLYYMSYHGGYADIYSIDLGSRTRRRVSNYPGINTGPAVAPGGRKLALVLSRDGNAELYVKDLGSGRVQRLTNTPRATEACPAWSPDGTQLAYVSDRSGSPQVYIMPGSGGAGKRVTFHGTENVSPDWGPDGRLAYSSRRGGRYQACVLNPATGEETQLTSSGADYEEPSWAPNGRHIVCAKTQGYHSDLYILDTLGDPEVRLTTMQGDWYSPAWSPR